MIWEPKCLDEGRHGQKWKNQFLACVEPEDVFSQTWSENDLQFTVDSVCMLWDIVGSAEATAYYEDVDLDASSAKIMQYIGNLILSIDALSSCSYAGFMC